MKNSIIILAMVMAMSCAGDKNAKPPAGLIARDTMVNLLVDMHVAQADVGMRNLPQDSADNLIFIKRTKILKSHNVDEEAFRDSYSYYLNNIQQMEEIYARIVDSLGLKETQASALGTP